MSKSKNINKGDIILIPFPFTDLSNSKLRPSLVLGIDASDVSVVFITSNLEDKSHTVAINPSETNGIKFKSYIRYSKMASLDIKMSVGKLGKLEAEIYDKVVDNIYKFIK